MTRRIAAILLMAFAVATTAFARLPPPPAPEIDPSSVGSALALVSSVVLIMSRRAKR
jgi:hypothetical protein